MKKKVDSKFLWYYLAKRIINNAEWREDHRKFYVKHENEWIILSVEEYKYLKRFVEAYDNN